MKLLYSFYTQHAVVQQIYAYALFYEKNFSNKRKTFALKSQKTAEKDHKTTRQNFKAHEQQVHSKILNKTKKNIKTVTSHIKTIKKKPKISYKNSLFRRQFTNSRRTCSARRTSADISILIVFRSRSHRTHVWFESSLTLFQCTCSGFVVVFSFSGGVARPRVPRRALGAD